MRIAVIADIHGNLVALDAVLDDLARDPFDELICLGDVALRGPQPRECIDRLRELGCPVVMGNTDEWLLGAAPAWQQPDEHDPVMAIDLWGAAQLPPEARSFLSGFRPTIEYSLGTTDGICFFHGSPRSNSENIFSTTPESELEQMLDGCHATVLVGGHTHIQMLRRKSDRTIVNVGSVGLPFLRPSLNVFDAKHLPIGPWAEYALIDCPGGRLSVNFRRVPIDLGALERSAHESGMPHAAWWFAQRDVLAGKRTYSQ